MWLKTIRLVVLLTAILIIAIQFQNRSLQLHRRVEAHGGVLITYLNAPIRGPIFSVDDMKPGDCEVRVVSVENSTSKYQAVTLKPKNIVDDQGLGSAMNITITDSTETYFEATVDEFYESGWISLGQVGPNTTNQYTLEVCMPIETGNEFQETVTSFDLAFNTKDDKPQIDLPPECQDLKESIKNVIIGTEGDDNISGTSQNDFIDARGGNDKVNAKSGHDCIIGGDGDDHIIAGSGADIILGGSGNDKLHADSGDDQVFGGDGDDELNGNSGDDYLNGGPGYDKLNGHSGEDTCVQGEQNQLCEL